MTAPAAPTDRFLRTSQVAEIGPWPAATWRYWRHIGYGPRSAKIGKTVVYKESEVLAWIEQQFAVTEEDSP